MKPRSKAQVARQDREYRIKGRYAQVNPCLACGKSAGDEYFSHRLTDTGDWNDIAIVLCKRCADATDHMENPKEFMEYAAKFDNAGTKAWERLRTAQEGGE